MQTNRIDWKSRAAQLGPLFLERAAQFDKQGRFVADNYRDLAEAGMISAAVPQEFGGGGATHAEICDMLRVLGRYCPSTALSLSMHQHLVAVTVWRHQHALPGEALLRRVASEQLVLVSTGAGDWLESHGEMVRVEGGYRVSAKKAFASGSPLGDVLVTSARYNDPDAGFSVLHFALPMNTPGVSVGDDWDALGMRGTGSNTVTLRDVFVPDAAISLKRPQKGWHPVWSIVLTVAVPIYMAPYLGVAERAVELARETLRPQGNTVSSFEDTGRLLVLGEMENALLLATLAHRDAVANARDYDFSPTLEIANRALQTKTLMAKAVMTTVDKAMEAVGGRGYLCGLGIERLWRDVRASAFHPLPEKLQQEITGRLALGLGPVP